MTHDHRLSRGLKTFKATQSEHVQALKTYHSTNRTPTWHPISSTKPQRPPGFFTSQRPPHLKVLEETSEDKLCREALGESFATGGGEPHQRRLWRLWLEDTRRSPPWFGLEKGKMKSPRAFLCPSTPPSCKGCSGVVLCPSNGI